MSKTWEFNLSKSKTPTLPDPFGYSRGTSDVRKS